MFEETKSLAEFILSAKEQFTDKINEILSPLYSPGKTNDAVADVFVQACQGLGKTPYPAQQDVINALALGLAQGKKALALVAEMGCGKTLLSIMTAQAFSGYKKRPMRSLVICPPQIVSTWEEEVRDIYGNEARVVNINGPDALSKLILCRQRRKIKPERPEFYIAGFNRMKTSYKWQNRFYMDNQGMPRCPDCGVPLGILTNTRKRLVCEECKTPLYAPAKMKTPKFAPVLFIKKYLKGYFDFLFADEVHQLKGQDTIQGAILGQLAKACKKTLILTGTLSGGKASDIFYIIQRAIALNFSKEERAMVLPPYDKKQEFASRKIGVAIPSHKP